MEDSIPTSEIPHDVSIVDFKKSLYSMVTENLDILDITETKLDESFPSSQFILEGYQVPLRLDRNSDGRGIMVYVREGILCRKLNSYNTIGDFEGIFFVINLRKNKWPFFGGYNPKKENIVNFLTNVASTLDYSLTNYNNLFLMGDFNSESTVKELVDFCKTYNLCNLVKKTLATKIPQTLGLLIFSGLIEVRIITSEILLKLGFPIIIRWWLRL